jgi:hypothetical protein
MKLVLDTTNKTIKIEEPVNLGELIDTLNKLLPSTEWREFKLETNTQIIQPYINPWIPYPWYTPIPCITYTEI